MLNSSLTELSAALAAKKLSSVELTRLCLDRIRALNGKLNAFITVDEERSLAQALVADERRAGKAGAAPGPLTGIPIAHKDIFCTRGLRTTCGSKMLANFISPYDAHVIERLASAGSVQLGKTNMDEFAMGSSNETSHFGPVKNPWDLARVPGGSSGGSAAAVAARMAPAATGTDTGGSIRQPAALTGVCGLKPTYGLVSRYGMIAFASSLDQGGPLAKSAADLALLMNAMAGFDARDSTSLERPEEDYAREQNIELAGLRIGLPKSTSPRASMPMSSRACARRSSGSSRRARKSSTSRCPTRRSRCRSTTWSRPPRHPPTFRASTACATATARRITRTSTTCTAARAPRVSARK
jgi:aspartyl-tRNA(Asn)/glutamyl-tRNA(Gln) amidotransferase subunit A